MAVVIRLARFGRPHKPRYRITVADQRKPHTGKFIEVIGYYNPEPSGQEKGLSLDMEKVKDWVKKGAQPTERVQSLIKVAEKTTN